MCATKINSQESGIAPSNENSTPSTMSTIVAVIPSNASENVMTILKGDPSSNPADETPKSQEIVDASDLTRDQWIQVL